MYARYSSQNNSQNAKNILSISGYWKNSYRWANQADVTIDNFSLNCPKCRGSFIITTTAFWTVDRVTSGCRLISELASVCLEHDIPNKDVAGCDAVALRWSVKYEKSSVDLGCTA